MWLIALVIAAQDVVPSGTWSGKLNVMGQSITLVFHLDGAATTLDSPDQGVRGIAATLECTGNTVKVGVPSLGATYEGTLAGDSIKGTFSQRGYPFPLTLTRGATTRNRPQTPQPPFPYDTEEVTFVNGDATLSGTLVTPAGCTAHTPVLVLVTGSGLQNRDEEMFEHKPFAVIADVLARQGIATLRYDDRGFGKSTGDLVNVTTDDLKLDALAGVESLRSRFDRVGVLGHSEGGTIALMLAAECKVDFAVCLAAGVVSGQATLIEQNRHKLRQLLYPNDVVENYCQVLNALFDDLKAGRHPVLIDHGLPTELEQNLQVVLAQSGTPYMRRFLALDVRPMLSRITCPVLALNGTKDTQVNCDGNLQALRDNLVCPNEIVPVEGANHLFQPCTTGEFEEYKDIEVTIAPAVLDTIVAWLKRL